MRLDTTATRLVASGFARRYDGRSEKLVFIHTVYFYPAEGAPAEAGALIAAACRDLLAGVPGVRGLHAGLPAGTPRDVVDNSYAAGLTVILDDADAHEVYQTHELHLQFIAENKQYWSRVQVYDYVE